MILLKQVIESFGSQYFDYIDFLQKFNIFDQVILKPKAIILLNSSQLEKDMNMLDDIMQEHSLYAHIIYKSPCQKFPSQLKNNCIKNGNETRVVEFIEKRFDIDFYTIERPIIIDYRPSLWDKFYKIFLKHW